jgi:hypothetical protein
MDKEHKNATATITEVKTKSGTSAKGHEWTLKEIVTNTGITASTFDQALGQQAEQMLNKTSEIFWVEEQKARRDGMGTFTARELKGFGEAPGPAQQEIPASAAPPSAGWQGEQVGIARASTRKAARTHLGPKATTEDLKKLWDELTLRWEAFMNDKNWTSLDRDGARDWSIAYCGALTDAAEALPIEAGSEAIDKHAREIAEHHVKYVDQWNERQNVPF